MDEQELSSLNKLVSDKAIAERWFAEAGIFPTSMADNLYAWARMQRGVAQARLEVSPGLDNTQPYVKFVLIPKSWFMFRIQERLRAKGGIIGKLGLLLVAKLGAPVFAGEILIAMSKGYLPGSYDVRYEYARE